MNDKMEEINKKIKKLENEILITKWIMCLLSLTLCAVTLF